MIQIQNLKLQEQQIPAAEEIILKVGDDPTTTSMLTIFRKMWDDGNQTEELKQAKNAIVHYLICEQMKANHGWFQPTRVWGDKTCRSCSGLGEILKFEKAPEIQACSCDEGFIWKECTSCQIPDPTGAVDEKGKVRMISTGVFTKKNGVQVPCRNCTPTKEAYEVEPAYWDAHKGQRRIKCRKCLGQKVIQNLSTKRKCLPIIESTTPCEICGGLGWYEPKQKAVKSNKGHNAMMEAAIKAGLEVK